MKPLLSPFRFSFLFLLASAWAVSLVGQTPLAIGQWESLQSYRVGAYVTNTPEEIAYSTGRAIFFIDKEDLSIRRLNREEGLAETEIRLIRYHEPTATLIIIYANSVIDLYRDGRFSTLRQIDNFNFSGGDNSINELFFGPDNIVYIAAGYGVSALDLDDETFLFTTFTGIGVNSVALFEGQLYASTDEGIYAVRRQGVNLDDFGNWAILPVADTLADYGSTAVNVWRDELYFAVGEDVWRLNDGAPAKHYDAPDRNYRVQYLSPGPFYLLGGYRPTEGLDRQVVLLTELGFDREIITNCVGPTNFAIEDEDARIWFGEDWEGVRYLPSAGDPNCERLFYPGPYSDRNYRLEHDGESLWVAAGILTINLSPTGTPDGLYRYRNGEWTTFNRFTREELRGRDQQLNTFDDPADYVGIAIDGNNDKVWVGTYFEGAFSLNYATDEIDFFDEENSTLQNATGEVEGRVRVGQPAVDEAGNVYFPNPLASEGRPVSVRSPEGQWVGLGGDCGRNEAFAAAIDGDGNIWLLHGINAGGGITVIDPGDDLFDRSDDRCRLLLPSNTELPVNEVRSIAVDLQGDVWIGTSRGVMNFRCGNDLLEPNGCEGNQPAVFDEIGNGGLLLETEDCFSITIDGANRKWIGTGGGAYLLSEDGLEQLAFFDEDNSPLLDNFVRDIAVDPVSGTVFFGTENGITSYRAEATAAGNFHREELTVFPNPVEPGYDGPIAIEGFSRDARVKITDLSGKLVFETDALGGRVLWDGSDYNGRRVQSGVYLVFGSSNGRLRFDNPEGVTGKIVFLR